MMASKLWRIAAAPVALQCTLRRIAVIMCPSLAYSRHLFPYAELLQKSCDSSTKRQEKWKAARLDGRAKTRDQVSLRTQKPSLVCVPAYLALLGGLCRCVTGTLLLRREAFDLFDTDGSGTIDAKELKVAMRYV